MHTTPGFQIAGNGGPHGPGNRAADNAKRDQQQGGQLDEGKSNPGNCEAAHHHLAFPANVKQTALKRQRHRQTGKYQRCCTIEHVAPSVPIAKRRRKHRVIDLERILPDQGLPGNQRTI